jgi:Family of unknown function (DUF6519)
MMYGDFSRMTFSPAKNFTAVWSQQGRVQLDADANEQTAILLHWLRTLAIDFIGPFGGHVTRAGFGVQVAGSDLTFSPGHYYVYGLRCDLPRPEGAGAPPVTYSSLVPGRVSLPAPPFVVQLFVWERSVSAVADPDLLEPALGPNPPDTTVRSQVAWIPQLSMVFPSPAPGGTPVGNVSTANLTPEYVSNSYEEYNAGQLPRPLLAARVDPDIETSESTIVPATSGYLGVENQLYRVEVHTGGTAGASPAPTFKWSRDNGSAEFRITASGDAETLTASGDTHTQSTVTLASLGRDERSLETGDWVELIDDTWAPLGTPAALLAVSAIDRAHRIVTLRGTVQVDLSRHPFLRRWDEPASGRGDESGIPITEAAAQDWDGSLELEDGVQILFVANGATYQRGDYWLIPARTATGRLVWPGGSDPQAIAPHGPTRFLAPLAVVGTSSTVTDMRTLFTHLAWPEGQDSAGPSSSGPSSSGPSSSGPSSSGPSSSGPSSSAQSSSGPSSSGPSSSGPSSSGPSSAGQA